VKLRILKPSETDLYFQFVKRLNALDPLRRDILSPTIESILKGKSVFSKSVFLQPVLVEEGRETVAACVFALVDRMPEQMQLACFEALPNQEKAVELLIEHGKALARLKGAKQLLVGLNFHVNYGLGILADGFQDIPTFGSAYNPEQTLHYFEKYAAEEVSLTTYWKDLTGFEVPVSDRLRQRMDSNYSVVQADLKDLEHTASIYTQINNAAFGHHRFYYERRVEEDIELFRDFKAFIKPENLLFLYLGDEPVGFMLWYPDFNQLMKPGETIGLRTWLRWKLGPGRINTFKIVEIGVVPEHQSRGGILKLFEACQEIVRGRYRWCEAGWILSDNTASRGFGERWADRENHHFKVFLIEVDS
jgi:hypothetical protein